MKAIEAFVKNPKWGNPKLYDLVIEKVKTGSKDWDVEYHVVPEPPTPLDPGIAELAKMVPVRLRRCLRCYCDHERLKHRRSSGNRAV